MDTLYHIFIEIAMVDSRFFPLMSGWWRKSKRDKPFDKLRVFLLAKNKSPDLGL